MSDSEKGNKGPGYEYWSRRNYKGMDIPGPLSKQITNRAERRKRKEQDKDIFKDNEDKDLDKDV